MYLQSYAKKTFLMIGAMLATVFLGAVVESAEPTLIKIGDTEAQVREAIGNPTSRIKLKDRVLLYYAKAKVTFRDGKVSHFIESDLRIELTKVSDVWQRRANAADRRKSKQTTLPAKPKSKPAALPTKEDNLDVLKSEAIKTAKAIISYLTERETYFSAEYKKNHNAVAKFKVLTSSNRDSYHSVRMSEMHYQDKLVKTRLDISTFRSHLKNLNEAKSPGAIQHAVNSFVTFLKKPLTSSSSNGALVKRYIRSVKDGIIALDDGTVWSADRYSKLNTSSWAFLNDVVMIENNDGPVGYNYTMINISEESQVHCKKLK